MSLVPEDLPPLGALGLTGHRSQGHLGRVGAKRRDQWSALADDVMVKKTLVDGYTMVILWFYYGYTIVILWLYYGYAIMNNIE